MPSVQRDGQHHGALGAHAQQQFVRARRQLQRCGVAACGQAALVQAQAVAHALVRAHLALLHGVQVYLVQWRVVNFKHAVQGLVAADMQRHTQPHGGGHAAQVGGHALRHTKVLGLGQHLFGR